MSRVSRTGYCLCILTITTWLIQFKLHYLSTPHITLQKPVPSHPHIIFILADDLGWNDVGFHGMNQIPTPNIDALAYSGVILHNYYTLHVCSPSRGALLTGMHPIHLGLQDSLLGSMTPSGLPLAFKLLPEYLKGDLGYATHIMGKWHLGAHRSMYTPTFRGFDSHVGFWHGQEDYFNHTSKAEHKGTRGYDFRRDMNISFSDDGKYVTDIITKESIKIIQNHNSARPLFLLVSHAAVHTPVQAHVSVTEQFSYINCSPAWHNKRQVFAAQLKSLDESVGHIVQVLQQEMMLENSIIVFSTDNGGAGDKYHGAVGSNFPLRGMKSGLFEGGIRGVGAVWSPLIQNQSRISSEMMTIYDWLPTLYSAAGGQFTELPKMDGVDLWPAISKQQVSPRKIILHNSSSSKKVYALRVQNYKIIQGTHKGNRGFNFWYGIINDVPSYELEKVQNSRTAFALAATNHGLPDRSRIMMLRNKVTILCGSSKKVSCSLAKGPCLFDIVKDPCEYENLLGMNGTDIPPRMLRILDMLQATIQFSVVRKKDLRGHPTKWNNTWTNFLDYVDPKQREAVIAENEERFRNPDLVEMDIQDAFFD